MDELIRVTEKDGKQVILTEICKLGITLFFIESVGIDIKEEYSEIDASKIVTRKAIVNYMNKICEKYNLTKGELRFITIENIDYVSFLFNSSRLPIDFVAFELYAKPFHQLPYSFMKNDTRYVSYLTLKMLYDMNIPKINKPEKQYKTYVMFDEASGFYKIGKALDYSVREKVLSSQFPKIQIILWLDYDIERELHDEFDIKRQRGEWFNLTADDILILIEKYGFKKH